MRSALTLLALLSLLAVGACTSAPAGWTYEPAPSVTPAPSTDASGSPSGAPAAGASGSPAASASAGSSTGGSAAPSGSAAASGMTVSIVASGIAFTTPAVSAPAGAAFSLEFDNQDAGTPHNVQLKDASGAQVVMTETFPGPAKKTYPVPALTAGSYPFVCTVHPNMTGTLTVQ